MAASLWEAGHLPVTHSLTHLPEKVQHKFVSSLSVISSFARLESHKGTSQSTHWRREEEEKPLIIVPLYVCMSSWLAGV